jgi:L-threonylcarbamoyladenylate synthase
MRHGGVVFFFSRATYGFATNGFSREGVEGVYRIKGREYDEPLAMLCKPDQIERWATVDASVRSAVRSLTARFWPGGVSLVLPKRRDAAGQPVIPDFMTSGIPTVSLMCMDAVAYALAGLAEYPIAATSANRSGSPPVTDPVCGIESFGDEVDLLLIGPPSDVGANTTILDLAKDPPRVLRPGPVPNSELASLVRGLVR